MRAKALSSVGTQAGSNSNSDSGSPFNFRAADSEVPTHTDRPKPWVCRILNRGHPSATRGHRKHNRQAVMPDQPAQSAHEPHVRPCDTRAG